jgi:hypothetical protein
VAQIILISLNSNLNDDKSLQLNKKKSNTFLQESLGSTIVLDKFEYAMSLIPIISLSNLSKTPVV